MRADSARAIGVLSLATLITAFASSCAAPPHTDVDDHPYARSAAPVATRRLAQLDFGRSAAFESCLPPACPVVTPKTLAIEVQSPPAKPRPIEPAAISDRGPVAHAEYDFERQAEGP
jgi:hypothetical protein